MDRGSLPWRAAMVGLGALLAGGVAAGLQSTGLQEVYAVVVAMAVATPPMAEGLQPDTVAPSREGRVRQALAASLAGLLVGFFSAFVLVLAGVTGGLLAGAAAGLTYAGGLVVRGLAVGGARSP